MSAYCILNVYIRVYTLFISMLVLEKIFERKAVNYFTPLLHPVCDVAKAGLLYSSQITFKLKFFQ